ncbi:MAG: membrane protein insertase YidC [Eubacteriales bacterium]|nr:membrane protein insertase YidC [Eubacteriales bacterium]
MLLLTKSGTPILGQIASIMGWIMNGIYIVLSTVGIQNIGLCIVIFSIIIYALMTPLQIKQQKFSKLQVVMQPELQKINKKYQNKKDQDSMMKLQEETQAVYQKYGVSPTGSCLQLLIQAPILLSLWQVIYRIPAYVGAVKDVLTDAMTEIVAVDGYTELIRNFIQENKITRVQLIVDNATNEATAGSIIDFLYALSPSQWESLSEMKQFSSFSGVIDSTAEKISHMQNFLGLNIADQPLEIIKAGIAAGSILLVVGAVMIPLLSWLTQMLNIKLMPQTASTGDNPQADSMASTMKMMNTFMPIMSAIFCFTFPVGLGIYWISSAVVRSIQQVIINRVLDKEDIQKLIEENQKKMEKKREKQGLPPQKITSQAHQNVKNLERKEKAVNEAGTSERAKKVEEAYRKAGSAKPGSITAKANMVRDFEERNKRRK